MRPASRVVAVAWSCALAACGGTSPTATGGQGGSNATAGSVGGAGSGGAGSGAGGAAGGRGAGGATGGDGEAPRDAGTVASAADADQTGADVGGDLGADVAASGCAPPAVLCDDFETYAPGATDLGPAWTTYTYSGAVRVDATKPRGGKQSLHLTTQAGAHHYADLIRETRGVELLPLKHFGRLMVWITAIPPSSHWNLNMSSGPMVGAPDEQAKLFEGGMYGKLMSNYAQRARIIVNGQELLRGGGPEAGDPGADADCAVAAPTQRIAAGKWVCWEWEFDGTADEAHLWVDGQPMTEVDAVGFGTQCQGPGFGGRPMKPTYRWESPQVFDKLIVGWEQYQDTPAQEVWIDDVIVSGARVGCPSP